LYGFGESLGFTERVELFGKGVVELRKMHMLREMKVIKRQ